MRVGVRRGGVSASPAPELYELLELEQDADIDPFRMLGEHLAAAASDLDDRAPRPPDQTSLMQVGDAPVQTTCK